MASDFSLKQALHLDIGGAATVQLDLSRVAMNDEQRAIVAKLLASLKSDERISAAEDQCEIGKCVASRYLSDDEFQKVRGLKATLGTDTRADTLIADFCLHVVNV
jgi:hypothetical protein